MFKKLCRKEGENIKIILEPKQVEQNYNKKRDYI